MRQATKDRRPFLPSLEGCEDRTLPTTFTTTSPTSGGAFPAAVSPVGGIVLDLIGSNGRRIVSQTAPSALFLGMFDDGTPLDFQGNPGTIGIQTGFTPQLIEALGSSLAEVAVRLTLYDGDTALSNFDHLDNQLLINGLALGDFTNSPTEEVTADGLTTLTFNAAGGFRNNTLDTGFFYSNEPTFLAAFRAQLLSDGQVVYQLQDVDPFDNFFDFRQGLSGAAIDNQLPPTLSTEPQPPGVEPIITTPTVEVPLVEEPPIEKPVAEVPQPDLRLLGTISASLVAVPVTPSPILIPPFIQSSEPSATPRDRVVDSLTKTAMLSGGGVSSPVIVTSLKPLAPPPGLPDTVARISHEVLARVQTILHLTNRQLQTLNDNLERALQTLVQQLEQFHNVPTSQPPAPPATPPAKPGSEESEMLVPGLSITHPPDVRSTRAAVWTVVLVLSAVVVHRRQSAHRGPGRGMFRIRRRNRSRARRLVPPANEGD